MSAQQLFSFQKPSSRETRTNLRLKANLRTVDRIRWTRNGNANGIQIVAAPRVNYMRSTPTAVAA